MSLNTAAYTAVQNDLTQKFILGMQTAKPFYPSVCTEINSNKSEETYAFLGAIPGVREWLGPRRFEQLRAGRFTIPNQDWETSLTVERNDIDDDNMGMYDTLAASTANRFMRHPDKLLISSIEAGDATACFDGQFFYDTDHAWGSSGSQSNLLTSTAATGTTPTAAEFKTAFNASVNALLGYRDDKGELLNEPVVEDMNSLVAIVPLALRDVAHEAIDALLNSGGGTNVVINKPKIVCMPGLSNAARFWTFNTDGLLRPFVFQKRRPISVPKWKGLDDPEFKELKMMADARYALGYFAWWTTVQTTFT